ncbi:hypothetical protein ABW21_db0208268 [Orbilia brochopaga]|nr:hypothetical protein ABW21_db0208268 [Drechslerella brochopaga]
MGDFKNTFGDMGLGSTFEKLSLGTQEQAAPGVSTLNFGSLYEEAFEDEGPAYKSGDSFEGQSFTSFYLNNVRSLFEGEREGSNIGIITCQHVKREREGLFDDPGLLFTEIQRLLSADANPEIMIIDLEPVFLENEFSSTLPALSKGLEGSKHEQPIIETIYDSLIKIWLESLPVECPAKTRLRRERLARMLSIDIGLSSLGACYNAKQAQSIDSTDAKSRTAADEEQLISMPALQTPLLVSPEEAIDGRGLGDQNIEEDDYGEYPQSRRSPRDSRLFLETFTPVTHIGSDPDLDALLNDWDIGQAPDHYQWRQISNMRRQAYEESQKSRSRSRSRTGSKQRRAASTGKSDREPDVVPNGDLHMTQPVTRTEFAAASVFNSSQATSSQRFPSSQVQRGHHGDSRKMKKRRTEGF